MYVDHTYIHCTPIKLVTSDIRGDSSKWKKPLAGIWYELEL